MKEFLGIGGYQREAEGAYSWQHLLFVSLLMVVMVGLAVFFGRKNKGLDDKSKNKVLIWAAILIDAVEIFLIIILCVRDGGLEPIKRKLPLFLCSIQLIAIPLAAFSKGKLRNAALDFVFIFGILGAVFGTFGATQNYNAYPVLSIDNVASGITHSISGFASLYIVLSGMESMKKGNILFTFLILIGFCVAAFIANITLDYNYMFLMNHDGTPYVIFYTMVGGNPVLYPMIVVGLFMLYVLLFYQVYFWIKNKSFSVYFRNKKELQASIAVTKDEENKS